MEFVDRESAYPNRYRLTDENGNASYVNLERADEPIKAGTPLNAETFNKLSLYTESEEHSGCYYRETDSGELEWLNPPFLMNVEYRTTERWRGSPIYAKQIGITYSGTMGNSESYEDYFLQHGISDWKYFIRLEANLNCQLNLPYVDSAGGWLGVVAMERDSLRFRLYRCVWNSPTLNATIYYTKQ